MSSDNDGNKNEPLQIGDGRLGWRANQHLIDALPYADILTPEEKAKAEQLIKEEMHRGRKRKKDYLDQLPPVQKLKTDKFPMLQQELQRLQQRKGMPKLDMSRYNMEPPPATRQWEANSWQHAVDNARSQLEHQYNRISNLELLMKYGVNAWRVQVKSYNQNNVGQNKLVAEMLDKDFQWQKKEVDRINRERKLGQMEGGKELKQLEQEWYTQVFKSSQMLVAMKQLQWEIEDLKNVCKKRGIQWEEEQQKPQLPPLPGEEESQQENIENVQKTGPNQDQTQGPHICKEEQQLQQENIENVQNVENFQRKQKNVEGEPLVLPLPQPGENQAQQENMDIMENKQGNNEGIKVNEGSGGIEDSCGSTDRNFQDV